MNSKEMMSAKRAWLAGVAVGLVVLAGLWLILPRAGDPFANPQGQKPGLVQRLWRAALAPFYPQHDAEVRESQEPLRAGASATAAGLLAGATVAETSGVGVPGGHVLSATAARLLAAAAARGGPVGSATGIAGETRSATEAAHAARLVMDDTAEATRLAEQGNASGTPEPLASGTPSQDPNATPTPHAPGGIQGRVYRRQTGNGVPGVRIVATSEVGPSDEQTTNDSGEYMIGNLRPGAYRVTAYASVQREQSVVVEPGRWSEASFELSEGSSISGRVLTYLQAPVSGAAVRLVHADLGNVLNQTQSGSDGTYVLNDAPVGERVRVEATYGGLSAQSEGPFVVYREPRTGVDLILHIGGTISGFVRNKSGQPIRGAQLEARVLGTWRPGTSGVEYDRPTTDQAGFYRFTSLPAGQWEIRAVAKGHTPQTKTVTLPEQDPRAELDFDLERSGGILEGIVQHNGSPVSGAEVFLHGAMDAPPVVTGSDGIFRFDNLPEGIYVVSARHVRYSSVHRAQLQLGGEPLILEMPALARITVRVTDPDNRPVNPFQVTLIPRLAEFMVPPQQVRQAQVSNRDGTGSWSVVSARYDDQDRPVRYDVTVNAAGYMAKEGGLDVSPGQTDRVLDLQLEWGATITGYVLDARDARPVAGALIQWRRGFIDVPLGHFVVPTWGSSPDPPISDGSGQFVLRGLPLGEVTVLVSAEGYSPWVSQGLLVAENNPPLEVRLRPCATLRGRIAHEGAPFNQAEVMLESEAMPGVIPDQWNTGTDSMGRFAIPGVCEGGYVLRITRWYRGSTLYRRYRIAVGTSDVDLDLNLPGGEVHVAIRDANSGASLDRLTVTLTPISYQSPPGPPILLPEPTLTLRQVDAEGRYTFVCLPAGQYRLEASGSKMRFEPKDVYLSINQQLYLDEVMTPESGS